MSRFLFVVPPLTGHINPTVAVGTALQARGHAVAWVGHASLLQTLLPAQANIFPTDGAISTATLHSIAARSHGLRGAEAFRFLWKDFIVPLAEATVPVVEAAVDGFAPDVLIADQQALAGSLVGRRRSLRWATSATTSSDLVDPFAVFPMFATWLQQEMLALQLRMGLPEQQCTEGDLRFSAQLVLAFTTRELVGSGPFPAEWLFVGPATAGRQASVSFPWDWLLRDRRHVLVTLGTLNAASGQHFFEAAMEAARGLQEHLQLVVISPEDLLDNLPDNVRVFAKVPQIQLLKHMDAVVCHAGHNTVCEALAQGIPLIVAPIRDDQPIVAQQVVDAGAGIRVKYGRVRPTELADAMLAVLNESSYGEAAKRVQTGFHAAGGCARAADGLELLAAQPTQPTQPAVPLPSQPTASETPSAGLPR